MTLQNEITIEGIDNILKETERKLKDYEKLMKEKDESIKQAEAEKV